MKRTFISLTTKLILISIFVNGSVRLMAMEGFWEPNSIPENLKKEFNLNENQIEKIRKSTLKISNGGTGVFVSPNGLVLTNQHVAIDFVQKISDAKNNYINNGFYADQISKELKLPEAQLSLTELQRDVTDLINGSIKKGMPPEVVRNVIIEQSKEIAAQTKSETGLDCEVLSTFNGTKHTLYGYKSYDDVRLVLLPEKSISTFGGEKDNFTFPRYWLDISFLRVYENGKPLQQNQFLPLSNQKLQESEKTIVAGFPISTERNLSVYQLEYLQNVELPLISNRIKTQISSLNDYAKLGNEEAVEVQSQVFGLENSLKAIEERSFQMKRTKLTEKTAKLNSVLMKKIKTDKEFAKDIEAFDALKKLYSERSQYEAERRLLDDGWALDTVFFRSAREHVRWATEKSKALNERLPGFNDELLGRLEGIMRTNVPQRDPHEKSKLENSLTMMKNVLGADHPTVKKILESKSPKERSEDLLKTQLDDQKIRIDLIEKGKIGLDESKDPMIILLRWIDQRAMELRRRYQSNFLANEAENTSKFVNALYRHNMNKKYPDANFSLRFSFGNVKSYSENGKKIGAFTNFKGLYKKARQNGFANDYNISERWMKNENEKTSATNLNFALTNDVVGGNSGSPVINTRGELVGLIFDSNLQSLLWKYEYDDSEGRSVAVDIGAIKLALEKYESANILKEINGNN